MNLRPYPPPPPELNLTPLVDVVFLLLLFFMISTTFEKERELPIALPEAEGQPTAAQAEPLIIGIDRNSHYVVAGQSLALPPGKNLPAAITEALAMALHQARPGAETAALLIEADAQAPHQAVMRVLDAAQQLGITQVAFATKHQQVGHDRAETPHPVSPKPDDAPTPAPQ